MTNKKLKVVCRNSPLSLRQVEEVFSHMPSIHYDLVSLQSYGDKNKHISLMANIASDFFTRELDEALRNEKADIGVHSAKDLPYPLPSDLELICLFEAEDKTDSLVSKDNLTLSELPVGARIGTSSLTRKAELLNFRSDFKIISIRGTIEDRIAQLDKGDIEAVIVATCALNRLGLEDRISQVLPFKTHALQGNLAVVGRKGDTSLHELFSPFDIRKKYGKVTLVGFGPGNPDLLTIGGDKALAKADIIFYDDLLDHQYLSRYKAQKIYVGKRKDSHSHNQDQINELIYQAALQGHNVVRLKGGDPMVFAHGREEIDYLKSRFVDVDVISGVSSGIALAAFTHIPLTHRGMASSVSFVTGHANGKAQVPDTDTIVYYMGGANLSNIASSLIKSGRSKSMPLALVYNVSLPDQKIFYSTLGELKDSTIKYPTPVLMIVGDVVSLENKTNGSCKILATGTNPPECEGNEEIVHTPLIKIIKKESNQSLKSMIDELGSFDWILFTSRYGVRHFFEILDEYDVDIRILANSKIASVGKVTSSELRKFCIRPDIESDTQSAEGLINYFRAEGLTNQKILLPRSDIGLKSLSDDLTQLGNVVSDIAVYKNIPNEDAPKVDLSQFQKIIFSSPSGVDAFFKIYGAIPNHIETIVKGKTTEKRLKEHSK